jgi:hypothetical protein
MRLLFAGLVGEEEFDIRKEVRKRVDGLLLARSVRCVRDSRSFVWSQAAYALCNACTGGSQQTLSGLVYHGVVGRCSNQSATN